MNDNFQIINLAKTPTPTFSEGRRNYIPWGEDNQLPEQLIEASQHSAIHRGILQSKIDYIVGSDVIFDNNNLIGSEKKMKKLIRKLAGDLEILGGCAIELIYSRNKKAIVEMNYIPIQSLRYEKTTEIEPEYVYYSKDWSNTRKYKPISIPLYNEDNPNKEGREIMIIKKYWAGNPYQIIPSYYGAMNYIHIDKAISLFHYSNLQMGMSPGLIIQFNDGDKDPEIKKKIVKEIQEKYKGSQNAGKIMVFFNKDKDKGVEIKQMEANNHDEMFNLLRESVVSELLTAHQITNPLLVGVKVPGELGGGDQLLQSNELFFQNVISPSQNLITESLNEIFQYNNPNFEDIKIKNKKEIPLAFADSLIQQALTTDEIRELMGYEPTSEDNENQLNNEE